MGGFLKQKDKRHGSPQLKMAGQHKAVASITPFAADDAHPLIPHTPLGLEGLTAGSSCVLHHLQIGNTPFIGHLLQTPGFFCGIKRDHWLFLLYCILFYHIEIL